LLTDEAQSVFMCWSAGLKHAGNAVASVAELEAHLRLFLMCPSATDKSFVVNAGVNQIPTQIVAAG
jgi:hypothetical protein